MINPTANPTLPPLLLTPALHVLVWGGQKLSTHLGKALPSSQPYGEAWELHDSATIDGGPWAGRTVASMVAEFGAALLGPGHDPADGMPLLIKFLDANDWLSVQVHPNDAECALLEGLPRGKNEAWYVIQADPGSKLINGVQPGVTLEALSEALAEGAALPLLHQAEVAAGDGLFMRAGTIHALGPGLLIYEVQQSCNITYRLYDWGRLGLDGQPRPLHLDKAMQVAKPELQGVPHHVPPAAAASIFETPFFITVRHTLAEADPALTIATEGAFQAITVLDGEMQAVCAAGQVVIPRGRTALIPACHPEFTLSGAGTALRSAIPPRN